MTIRQFRDTHQKDMAAETMYAGEFLEANGLLFGHDFVTGDALTLAAEFYTRKMDEAEKDKLDMVPVGRFHNEDWGERFG